MVLGLQKQSGSVWFFVWVFLRTEALSVAFIPAWQEARLGYQESICARKEMMV